MPDPSVAVVAPNFAPRIGGIESFVAGLAASAWPATTTVVAPPEPGAPSWDAGAPFTVVRRRLVSPVPPRWLQARPLMGQLAAGSDVVVCSEWWPAARAAAAFRSRRPSRGPLHVLLVYGTEVVTARGRAEVSLRRAVGAMDLLVAISEYTAGQVRDRIPECPPIEILNPGVDIEPQRAETAEVRQRLALGDGPIVLTAARLVARKGHARFAAVWPQVLARVPDAQWVVTGDGPCADELRRVAGPSVRMVGPVDRPTLTALYAMSDVHLLPGLPATEVEGFGMAVVEAGVAGTPSVASDLGGTAEALGDGGLLVPGGDMAAMAGAVTELLLDGSRRDLLGRRARRRAEELRWDLVGARFRAIITDHLGRPRVSHSSGRGDRAGVAG